MASEDSQSFSYKGMSSDNIKGLVLALSSSFFIGASFIVKKKGLKKAGASGIRAGSGGYSYLYEPLWWVGMITMIVGEVANFAAYAFAPAILVTPLGALSIIIRHDLVISLLCGTCCNNGLGTCIPLYTTIWPDTHIVLHRSLFASGFFVEVMLWQVMSVKALGIALKLTLSGMNQLIYPQTWVFTVVVAVCVITQMNYLNKALDTFNTAVVSPIYYVMFTSLTILASVIMFKDWDRQNPTQIVTEMCGFVTILSGTFLLHKTKDMADGSTSPSMRPLKHTDEEDGFGQEGVPLRRQDSMRLP
ncbi:hypothetical protein RJ639_037585 [Escallonia herrerae]|uniref:Probable magnesium transporter n=1 Tax=Escallonia herrerae TaxID=1293975 RepID=A0AA88WI08_9ASTE|nr:hypothetical protein RJ639_037585 [Escallonia herrerae]